MKKRGKNRAKNQMQKLKSLKPKTKVANVEIGVSNEYSSAVDRRIESVRYTQVSTYTT